MPNAVMVSVSFLLYYAVYGYAECLYDKYITLYVILSVTFTLVFSECFYARCRYAGCSYSVCHYTEYCYAECHSIIWALR
jgi:hypothetical protein